MNVDVCILLILDIVLDFILNMFRGKFIEKVIEILDKDFIFGFYVVKDKFDEVMCLEIKVICKCK